jgi:hypothetical protein
MQAELKTTTAAGAALHDVYADLGQPWQYCHRPPGHQPFYVFPFPVWRGNHDHSDGRARALPASTLSDPITHYVVDH